MKTFRAYKNNLKNNIMYRLTFLFSMLIALNASAKINNNSDYLNSEESKLEKILFNSIENSSSTTVEISAIEVIEIEEEVELGFDTAKYLPENFNALKGKHDLDWNTIELIEIEEEIELGFDTVKYLPENFNALKGKYDLDWNTIELIETEEEVELGFDTANYLPENFNALKGKHDLDWNTIELIEIEEEVELGYSLNMKFFCSL